MPPERSPQPGLPARRRFPVLAFSAVVVLLVAALAWSALVVPALVKYPTDLDTTVRYEGTFRLLVNPATAAPLAEPLDRPLTVERHLRAVPEESDSSTVLVRETVIQRAEPIVDVTQENAYVMDRSTAENLADPRAYAFTPENVVDRSGSYRLHLPFGVSGDAELDIYKNEIGAAYVMSADAAAPTAEVEGLQLRNFSGAVTGAPAVPEYLAEVGRMAPLPATMTLDQLKPHLVERGLDLDATLAGLEPQLDPADAAALATIAATRIPLEYVLSFGGRAGVETVTGTQVRVDSVESLGVQPRPEALAPLGEVLARYPSASPAVDAASVFDGLAEAAIPLFEYDVEQTPASVAEVADRVQAQRRQIQLAQVWVPVALVALAGIALLVGVTQLLRRPGSSRPIDLTAPQVPPARPEPPPVGASGEDLTAPRPERR